MRTVTYVALAMACMSSPVSSKTVNNIVDAGVYCGKEYPKTSTFYTIARNRCLGKQSCKVSAIDVASLASLQVHQCTGFFVNVTCKGGGQFDFESKSSLTRHLLVHCSK